jgi:hypothetical protein
MSDRIQFAQHPDADQLTAFAEHVLPAHEQQETLAHLAGCADCRRIVFLVQEAVPEEAALLVPVAARRPWFSGWNLAWATAAALTIVAFSVHLRNVSHSTVASPPVVTAAVEQPAQPATIPAEPATLPDAGPPAKAAAAPVRPATLGAVGTAKPLTVDGIGQRAANDGLQAPEKVLAGRSSAEPTAATLHGALGGTPSPSQLNFTTVAPESMVRRQAAAAKPTGNLVASDQAMLAANVPEVGAAQSGAGSASQVGGQATLAQQQQIQPLPAAAPPAPQLSSHPTQMSQNAPQSITQTGMADANSYAAVINATTHSSISSLPAPMPTLPSRLAALSTASNGSRTVAIDSAGTLFFSKDKGQHWRSVVAVWSGRGGVWTSKDGQSWKAVGN